jgi:Na+(H+)/acetate symporter ActP
MINTAIGQIDPTNLQGFVQQLLNLAFGVAGGIAFLLMLFGVFQVMTSAGNPERMKSGSELITSALTGLLFIVFSIFILKLIGITVLDIPGFGG